MRWTKRVVAAAAVALMAVCASPVLRADCVPPDFRAVGNNGLSTLEWNLADPNAGFAYFSPDNALVNEGLLGDPANFRLQVADLGGGEALYTMDIGGSGFNTTNCPATGQRLVVLHTDRKGTTCVSVTDHADVTWNFDTAIPAGARDSAGFPGAKVLPRSTMSLTVMGATRNAADLSTNVTISWQPPSCNVDAPFTLPVASYDVFKLVLLRVTATKSADPSTTPGQLERIATGVISPVTVTLPRTTGTDTFLVVGANLGTSGRAALSGTSSPIATDPTLVTTTGPGQGKGKGLTKAPGQNK